MKKLFVLHPGPVESKSDGQTHYIEAWELAILYGVNVNECHVVDYKRPETYRGIDFSDKSRFIHLYPQYHKESYDKMREKIQQLRTLRRM